ncbi:hypothetical protein [Algoriphagus resistens]|uniref:hypothetical protein n=1 Tax=Algoriphagus resistens TaxID=1750590 RepID=UPI0007167A3B|nr:hypothetical protein [Algoriphagus resistens]
MDSELTIKIKQAHNITELQELEAGEYVRRIGMVYFQLMDDGKYLPRCVTAHTNGKWLLSKLKQKRIYVPVEEIRAEVI